MLHDDYSLLMRGHVLISLALVVQLGPCYDTLVRLARGMKCGFDG